MTTSKMVPCACGCGERIESVDDHGRERRYVAGHNARERRADDTPDPALGRAIKLIRTERQHKAYGLATRAGINAGTYSRYETGRSAIPANHFAAIARELKVSKDTIRALAKKLKRGRLSWKAVAA